METNNDEMSIAVSASHDLSKTSSIPLPTSQSFFTRWDLDGPLPNRAAWLRDQAWRRAMAFTLLLAFVVLCCVAFIPALRTPWTDLSSNAETLGNTAIDQPVPQGHVRFQIVAQTTNSTALLHGLAAHLTIPSSALVLQDQQTYASNADLDVLTVEATNSSQMSGVDAVTVLLLLVRKGDPMLVHLGMQQLVFAEKTWNLCTLGYRGDTCSQCIVGYTMMESTCQPEQSNPSGTEEQNSLLASDNQSSSNQTSHPEDVILEEGMIIVFGTTQTWRGGFEGTISIAQVDESSFEQGFAIDFVLPFGSSLNWLHVSSGEQATLNSTRQDNRELLVRVDHPDPHSDPVIELRFQVSLPADIEAQAHSITIHEYT
jgi:hypothetical protein